ncbi:MAG: hypothetical protein CMC35_03160 [Flavobacteriaceae bacterium]|nr:hypothetical protein [Flavobacteriaceae bacterium]|tara:strand:+ start:714 stop:1121 length:408 start_codon:yes stop_codon:yes gene_type:complete
MATPIIILKALLDTIDTTKVDKGIIEAANKAIKVREELKKHFVLQDIMTYLEQEYYTEIATYTPKSILKVQLFYYTYTNSHYTDELNIRCNLNAGEIVEVRINETYLGTAGNLKEFIPLFNSFLNVLCYDHFVRP